MSDLFKAKMKLKKDLAQIRDLKYDPNLKKKEVKLLEKQHKELTRRYEFYEKYLKMKEKVEKL